MKPDRSTLIQEAIRLLQAIAPELDADTLAPERPLRQQLDLDSMDWLNFLVALHQRFQVEIPESDYAQLRSLDNVADYLSARLA
jgi:acyl carrier protein